MSRSPNRPLAPPIQDLPDAPMGNWPPRGQLRSKATFNPILVAGLGAGALIVIGIIVTVVIVSVNAVQRRQANVAAIATLEREAEALRASALSQLDSQAPPSNADDYVKFVDTMERSASNTSGQQALVLQAGVNTLRSMQEQVQLVEASFQEFMNKGGIDPATMPSKKSVEDRLAMAKQLQVASRELDEIVEKLPARFEQELTDANVSPAIRQREMASLREQANLDLIQRIREEEKVLCTTIIGSLTILHKEWGRWEVDGDMVMFENDSALAKYNKFIEDMQSAASRQEALQRQLLASPSRRR